MSKWNKISLFKFQQIDQINATDGMAEIDKLLFSTCIVFDMTEYQLDQVGVNKATRLINKVSSIFSCKLNARPRKRIGKYFINYDISKITFGQFVELAYFLSSKSPIQNAHYILASVSRIPFFKYNSGNHRQRADYFLARSIPKVAGSMAEIVEQFTAFTNEYKSLFGLDEEINDGDAQSNSFNKRYGWIYAASQVAEYERITLDQAFTLPVRQAFNDLAYLKAKGKYEAEQFKKKM